MSIQIKFYFLYNQHIYWCICDHKIIFIHTILYILWKNLIILGFSNLYILLELDDRNKFWLILFLYRLLYTLNLDPIFWLHHIVDHIIFYKDANISKIYCILQYKIFFLHFFNNKIYLLCVNIFIKSIQLFLYIFFLSLPNIHNIFFHINVHNYDIYYKNQYIYLFCVHLYHH